MASAWASSSSSAATRPARVKRVPITAARRSTPRSAAASSSIWSAIKASTESGRVWWSAPPRIARTISVTKSGLPSERPPMASATCAGSGASSVSWTTSFRAAAAASGARFSAAAFTPGGAANPSSSGRRATTRSQRRAWMPAAMWAISAADASSIKCASSTTMSAASGSSRSRSASTLAAIRSETKSSSSAALSGVAGRSRPTTSPSSGSHGARPGARSPMTARRRRSTAGAGV